MECVYDYVLFDLDGTLTASAPGIRRCIELTMEKMDKAVPDLSDYSRYIGPPLITTFQRVCGLDIDEAKRALSIYLDFYDTEGEPRNSLFAGTFEMLGKLKESGAKIAVCTSKNEVSARNVCKYLGITELLDALCGSDHSTGRREKEDIIPYAMETLGAKQGDKIVMIGDTHFDARGAKANGVDFIGVTYGYGKKDDMINAGAEVFADSTYELCALLTDNDDERADDCRFISDNRYFQVRAGAVIIEDGCVLLAKNDAADYYYSVGGGVKLLEYAEDAVKREVFEETGIEYQVDRLLFIHENFFVDEAVLKDKTFHEISFYYLMKPQGKKKINKESHGIAGREYMHWVPIEKLKDVEVYPVFFKERLLNLSENIEHIVTDEINNR